MPNKQLLLPKLSTRVQAGLQMLPVDWACELPVSLPASVKPLGGAPSVAATCRNSLVVSANDIYRMCKGSIQVVGVMAFLQLLA